MSTMKVYQRIACTLQAIENCKKSDNQEWITRHQETLHNLLSEFPHGSGFDSGTTLDDNSTPEKLIFNTEFHHMDDNGFYCGWSEHQVIITPSLAFGFNMRITGRNVRDIKDYIAETFEYCLNSESDHTNEV